MFDKDKAPPPPNYTPIAAASEASAKYAADLSREQLDWAKEQFAANKGATDKVVDSFLAANDENQTNARHDRARYEDTYQPLENDLVNDARDFASPERKELEMGRAQARVGQQFDAARQNATRELESYGVNPASTRFAALDLGTRMQEAATKAAAANQASQMVDATGRAMRSEAINVGRGLPGQIAGTYNTALQAGTGAVNAGNATTGVGANTMGTAPQWQSAGTSALSGWGNTLNTGFNNQLGAFKANQDASSGFGAMLGMGAGLGMKALMLADGGEVPGQVPAEGTPGGAVPIAASPSGGKAIDDVPARLTPGEFVVPKDVALWLGEEKLQKMIVKAREDRSGAKAKPKSGPALPMAPTFRSQALPVG